MKKLTLKQNSIALYVLAGLITAGFFVFLFLLIIKPIPVQNEDLINIAAGALIGAFSTGVVGYFFGSSAGSAEKNEIIANKDKDISQ